MTFIEKVSAEEIREFIFEFYNKYNEVPKTGFIAGFFKVSIYTIYNKLDELEKSGIVERLVLNKNKTSYQLTKNGIKIATPTKA